MPARGPADTEPETIAGEDQAPSNLKIANSKISIEIRGRIKIKRAKIDTTHPPYWEL